MVNCASGCRKVPNYGTSSTDEDPRVTRTYWQEDPLVKVCPTSPFAVSEVQWALDLWAKHGAPQLQAFPDSCIDQTGEMTVYVDMPYRWMAPEWEPNMRAATFLFSEKKGAPIAIGFIAIPLDVQDRRTLVHEVGHIWLEGHQNNSHLAPYVTGFEWEWGAIEREFRRQP